MSSNLNLMEQKENANADCLQRLVRRLREQANDLEILEHLKPYAATDIEAADWMESAVKALQLYERAAKLKCSCDSAPGCQQCDLIIEARNLVGYDTWSPNAK